MIGVIGAVDQEAIEIKKEMTDIIQEKIGGISFYKGKLCGKDIVFVQSGIGKVNAALTATLLIDRFDVEKVIFSGVAGSLNKELNVGDIVIGIDVVQHDVDATEFGYKLGQIPQMKEWAFEGDKELIEKVKSFRESKERVFFGRILTGDQFVSKKDKKVTLGNDFSALCVDMESGAVAQVCTRLGKGFLIIRSISDSITDESGMEYNKFVELAAKNSKKLLKEILG
nr:5'-methylthioadenosine/adenosylhomocysteine nucleosidase [uncultured Leptotrichia sp.]